MDLVTWSSWEFKCPQCSMLCVQPKSNFALWKFTCGFVTQQMLLNLSHLQVWSEKEQRSGSDWEIPFILQGSRAVAVFALMRLKSFLKKKIFYILYSCWTIRVQKYWHNLLLNLGKSFKESYTGEPIRLQLCTSGNYPDLNPVLLNHNPKYSVSMVQRQIIIILVPV